MIKKIAFYLLSFIVVFAIAFKTQSYVLETLNIELRYSLLKVHLFHCVLSFIICASFLFFSNNEKWASQLGYIYIFTFISKFLFFAVAFKESLFELENLSKTESLNLLIPLFLFLFLEVYFIAKILNKKEY